MKTSTHIIPDLAVPPGDYIAEIIVGMGMSQVELAKRMEKTPAAVNEIIKGAKAIIPETAFKLESVLGVRAGFWMGLESQYQLSKAQNAEREALARELEEANRYPVAAMKKLGWLPKEARGLGMVEALRQFFGVAKLGMVQQMHAVAFRKQKGKKVCPYAMAAWLRQGARKAAEISCGDFDAAKVKQLARKIPAWTLKSKSEMAVLASDELAKSGVSFVEVEHLPGTYAQGAAYWVGPKAVVQLSGRYKFRDVFAFDLLHELGHVLMHAKKNTYIREDTSESQYEKEADFFARNSLIDSREYETLIQSGTVSAASIKAFAHRLNVHPGVVAGRVMHDLGKWSGEMCRLRVVE